MYSDNSEKVGSGNWFEGKQFDDTVYAYELKDWLNIVAIEEEK